MKTTLMIDDTVLRMAKQRAAAHDTTVSELVNQSLRAYLHAHAAERVDPRRFSMPVFGRTSVTTAGVSPARLAELRDEGR